MVEFISSALMRLNKAAIKTLEDFAANPSPLSRAFVVTPTFITHALNVLQEIRDGDHRDEKSAHWWKRKTDFVAWLAQDDRAPLAGQGWARLTGLERKLADLVKTKMDERIRVTEEYEQRLAQEVDEAKEQ